MHLIGFIIRIYHDVRSSECNYITVKWHVNFFTFKITVVSVKAKANSIMSSFMIYNPCQISNNYRDQKKEDGRGKKCCICDEKTCQATTWKS